MEIIGTAPETACGGTISSPVSALALYLNFSVCLVRDAPSVSAAAPRPALTRRNALQMIRRAT